MVFHWSLSDSKSPQVSGTLLSILAILNNSIVWMVSTRLSTFKSTRPFNNPLVTVPTVPADYRVKLKESEKRDTSKLLDLARELKNKLWNIKEIVISIVNEALLIITKRLVVGLEDLDIRGRVEIIQSAVLLRLARILRRVLET